VADSSRTRIEAGEWPRGAALPSLAELGAEYGVSAATARKAVAALAEAGLVESHQGWGNFIV
jgi:DNA-binding GntR family transcriptional regulator